MTYGKVCPDVSGIAYWPPDDVCGVDITDRLATDVLWHVMLGGEAYDCWRDWSNHGTSDYKEQGNTGDGSCADGDCHDTYGLCGLCVKKDVPGNIGGMAACGPNVLGWGDLIIRVVGDFGDDLVDQDDRAAYDIGRRWRSSWPSIPDNWYAIMNGDLSAFKAALCGAVQSAVDAGSIQTFKQCRQC